MKAVVASNNPNKIREIKAILSPLGWQVLSQPRVNQILQML